VAAVRANATVDLPFRESSFDLVLVVHFVADGLIGRIGPLLRGGGYLLIETYGGHGANWMALPQPGQMRDELACRFEIIDYRERLVGPTRTEAASVKFVARRR
jgi:hypothetical protein